MFETAELGQKVSKRDYRERVPELRERLLELQARLRQSDFPVVVLFAGVDAAGKSETASLLQEWMDPHWMVTRAFGEASQEEGERPEFWRFWRDLPPRGYIGTFLSAWYHRPLLDRVYRRTSEPEFDERLERVLAFERMLADDGALILKFWMHLGKQEQRKRLKTLEKDPLQQWRVTAQDWDHWKQYGKFVTAAEQLIRRTSTGFASWTIVEGTDPRYRSLKVGGLIADAIARRLDEGSRSAAEPEAPAAPEMPAAASSSELTVLDRLDLTKSLGREKYRLELRRLQGRLHVLHRESWKRKASTIVVFEGWDAAGKGGAIRRTAAALDARNYQVIPIAAPTDEERAHHYLWRFWRHLPRAGRVTFFDRSWYGRVLVERVEGLATDREWRRAYAEINDFENQLIEHGIVLLKFWLHITKQEQKARFEARQATPYKRWKLSHEDWRNREKWEHYELAVHKMIERTSTAQAPWILVEANDKRYARIKVLRAVCDKLAAGLGSKTPDKSRVEVR